MGLFDKPPSVKDVAKQQKRDLKGVTRDLDRDQRYLESEEKKLAAEVKAAMQRGDESSARILAKQMVRLREQKSKAQMMKSNVTAAGYNAQSIASQATMTKAMASTTKTIATMNQQVNMREMQGMMAAYEKESAKMEMGAEMMDDAFDSVFEGNEVEESEVMDKIYDEIGIDFSSKVGNAPTKISQKNASQAETTVSEADVEARMAALLGQ